jgi:hypothetical protein
MKRETVRDAFMRSESFAFEWVLAVFCRTRLNHRDDLMRELFKMPPEEIQLKAMAVYDILFGTEGSDA